MVKMVKYCLALLLVVAFAAPAYAQDDFPKFLMAPGYGNIGNDGLFGSGRHSGFTLGTDFNLNSKIGAELFTGYYDVGNNATLYTNTFGVTGTLRSLPHVIPYGTAGFGFGSVSINTSSGSFGGRAMATRIGGGIDVPFTENLAIRIEATRMGFHFDHTWNSGANYSLGLVLNLTQ